MDFGSLIDVRLLAKHSKSAIDRGRDGTENLAFTEVLPPFDELWLKGADGKTYTRELRLVAIHRGDVTCP